MGSNITTMSTKQRVDFVNNLLSKEGFDLKMVADECNLNYSTFTKLMQEDDYVYIKRENSYFKFVRDEMQLVDVSGNEENELAYVKNNIDVLKELIERYKNKTDFSLDKRLFKTNSKITPKNIRITDDLYSDFIQVCKLHFPYLRIQDILSQIILQFTDEYSQSR